MTNTPVQIRWLGTAFVILGLGLEVGAGIAAVQTLQWLGGSTQTTGVVIDLVAKTGRRSGHRSRAEVVRFSAPDGRDIEFQSTISTSSPFSVGETVPVRFDPADPTIATIDTPVRRWFVPALLAGIGLTVILFGGTLRSARRRAKAGVPQS